MAREVDLIAFINDFPSPNQVVDVCRTGKRDQCGALFRISRGDICLLNNGGRIDPDKPINCQGILGVLQGIQAKLSGSQVIYEDPPFFRLSGIVKGLTFENGTVTINPEWEDREARNILPSYHQPIISIDGSESLVFEQRGWGGIPGEMQERTTIVIPPTLTVSEDAAKPKTDPNAQPKGWRRFIPRFGR